jgi:hypothetical protein
MQKNPQPCTPRSIEHAKPTMLRNMHGRGHMGMQVKIQANAKTNKTIG